MFRNLQPKVLRKHAEHAASLTREDPQFYLVFQGYSVEQRRAEDDATKVYDVFMALADVLESWKAKPTEKKLDDEAQEEVEVDDPNFNAAVFESRYLRIVDRLSFA